MATSSPDPVASIVIRAKNEAGRLHDTLTQVFSQAFRSFEVILVDSGSTDATLEIAARFPLTVVRIPPEDFTYGRALNIGYARARGDFLVALSAHAVPVNHEWLNRLLIHFEDPRVAGVWGSSQPSPDSAPAARPTYRQDLSGFLRNVYVGFTNANSAVRRELWQIHKFREDLPGTEDKEWAYRVLSAGYVLVYDGAAAVLHFHRESVLNVWRRSHREHVGFAQFLAMPRFSPVDILRHSYWEALHRWRKSARGVALVRFGVVALELPTILAYHLGRYTGLRARERSRPLSPMGSAGRVTEG